MRKAQMFLAVLLLICVTLVSANAEILTIDLDNASYEEIDNAYQILKQARIDQLKKQLSENVPTDNVETKGEITFRGIPWGTTRKEVEQLIGYPSSKTTSYIHIEEGVVDDDIGIETTYKGTKSLTLAGYAVSYTSISYAYQVIDGTMLRDTDMAIMFFAEYDIWDVGDESVIVEDLTAKLIALYGQYTAGKWGERIWEDAEHNQIQLSSSSTRVYVFYVSGQANQMIGLAENARDAERAEQEELVRIQNQNNYDGL